jgi:secondary thiamine-phosphate synthase enzyme
MPVYTKKLSIPSKAETQILDISDAVEGCIVESRMASGIVSVHAYRSTCAIATVEYEPGLIQDLQELFEKLVPREAYYHHEETWHDGNGFSHVRSSLFGTSKTFNLIGGRLHVYPWQQIILLDFAPQGDAKEVSVVIVGE